MRKVGGLYWLSQKEACVVLGVSPQRVRQLANEQKRIAYFRDGRNVFYKRADVLRHKEHAKTGRPRKPWTREPSVADKHEFLNRLRALESDLGAHRTLDEAELNTLQGELGELATGFEQLIDGLTDYHELLEAAVADVQVRVANLEREVRLLKLQQVISKTQLANHLVNSVVQQPDPQP